MDYEVFVQDYFTEQFSISLRKIQENPQKKSPDFEYFDGNSIVFLAELKTIVRYLPSEQTGWTITHHSDFEMSAARNDNAPNRVANMIEKAFIQLKDRSEPKIVLLLNDAGLDILDLKEAVDGYLDYQAPSGKIIRNNKSAHVAERLRPTLNQLDAMIWIERRSGAYKYISISERGLKIGNQYFSTKDSQ